MATPSAPGALKLASLVGNELIPIINGGPLSAVCTASQIAALSGSGITQDIVNTAITTVGNGTLTAAGIAGGLITRTGPVAAYSDATDTAAAIVAAFPSFVSGATFFLTIKNATAFEQTITGGVNVVIAPTNIIGPFEEGLYYGSISGTAAVPLVTLNHLMTNAISLAMSVVSPQVTTINTVGAGTITAAAINGGNLARTGTQTVAFADTSDIATAIIAGNPGLVGKIGSSFIFYYGNTTTWPVTFGGGTGVTVSGITIIPAGSVVAYLVTYTAAATITMVGIGVTQNLSTQVAIAGSTSGEIILTPVAIAGQNTLTLPAVTGTVATTSGSDLYIADIYRSASSTALANATPGAINGMSAIPVSIGTYRLKVSLPNTGNGTSGIQITFTLATAVFGAISTTAKNFEAAAVQTQYNATVSSGTALFASTTASLEISIDGTFTVTTAGTVTFNAALNTGTTSAVIQAGAYVELVRIV